MFGVSQRRICDWITEFENETKNKSDIESESDEDSLHKLLSSSFKSSWRDIHQDATASGSASITAASKKRRFVPSGALDLSVGSKTISNTNAAAPVHNPKPISEKAKVQILDLDIETEVYNWVQSRLPLKTSSTAIRDKAREMYR